jgi:acetyl-CoA acyltransferase
MPPAVILSAARTPVGRAWRGSLARTRPDELGAAAVRAALARAPAVKPEMLDDLVLGCAFPEAEQGLNVARVVGFLAGLPDSVPALTVNRFCASSLQALAQAAERIESGRAELVLAGGLESMSMVPMTGNTFRPNPALGAQRPEAYIGMGLTAERVAERYAVPRAEQDAFALRSHRRAVAAQKEGRFDDELVPFTVRVNQPARGGGVQVQTLRLAADEGPRADTTPEALAALKPAFKAGGTVTAGNSSQTSDGAAALVLASEARCRQLGLAPMARVLAYAVAGVAPDVMGIGPVLAVPKALAQAGLKVADIDLWELNEAFAAQAVYCARELGLPEDRLNVNGGAIALGHPLGATGARLTATLLHELQRREGRYGVVTLCVGGGMGVAAVFEALRGWKPNRATGET